MAEKQKDLDSDVALYDLGYHLIDSIPEDEVVSHAKRVQGFIEKEGGKVVNEKAPVRISLAYTISRMTKGKREDYSGAYFGTLIFECERSSLSKIEKAIVADPHVLRHLLIETDAVRVEEALAAEKALEKEEAPAVSDEELDKSIEALTA
jgi:ribosomal protein S6